MRIAVVCMIAISALPLLAAEWQWSVPVSSVISDETKSPPRAFLWIPPPYHTLRLTAIPPRAKFPLKVTVVAWQYGRASEPRLKSAVPVERTFAIVSTAGKKE